MDVTIPQYGSDYHLLLLAIKIDGVGFFDLLFNEKSLLENLTHSIYINSTITDTNSSSNLKYKGILDVKYEWNSTTGILLRKVVTAPSGLQLLIVPGIGLQAGQQGTSGKTSGSINSDFSVLVLIATLSILALRSRYRYKRR